MRSSEQGDLSTFAHRWHTWAQPALDFIVVSVIWVVVLGPLPITTIRPAPQSIFMMVWTVIFTMYSLHRFGLYDRQPNLPRTDEISAMVSGVVLGAASLAVLAAFTDWSLGSRELLVAVPSIVAVRSVLRSLALEVFSGLTQLERRKPVIVAGVGEGAANICKLIADHPESSLQLLGLVGDPRRAQESGQRELWLGDDAHLGELLDAYRADAVIVCPSGLDPARLEGMLADLLARGTEVLLSPGVASVGLTRMATRSLVHEPLILLRPRTRRATQRAVKRVFDLLSSLVLLVLCIPLMLGVALAIKIDSRGPVLYRSPRYGKRAEYFEMLKFRSMTQDADARRNELVDANDRTGPIFKITDDPRVTRVGRFIRETSLDELPQFFNVLKGDMSLVGPRPALPDEEAAFEGDHRARFDVRPGITGLWQVEARSNASFDAYRRLDLHYLENWSLWLDVRILLATAEQVAISVLALPIRRHTGNSVDAVHHETDDTVVDLREAARRRFSLDEASANGRPFSSDSTVG